MGAIESAENWGLSKVDQEAVRAGAAGRAGSMAVYEAKFDMYTAFVGAMRDCASPRDWERHEGASGRDLQLGAEEETWWFSASLYRRGEKFA